MKSVLLLLLIIVLWYPSLTLLLDLKTENVFLNKRNVIKLGDFGISKILDNTIDVAKTVVGTPSYLSPELCQDIPYNSKSDVWAVGCLLYEMCALDRPFDGQSLIRLFFNIVKAEYKPLPPEAPAGIQDLVACMLVKEPERRPSASALLNLPYVKQHLASFISDTESFRAGRARTDEGGGGGDANSVLSPVKKSKSPNGRSPTAIPHLLHGRHSLNTSIQVSQDEASLNKVSHPKNSYTCRNNNFHSRSSNTSGGSSSSNLITVQQSATQAPHKFLDQVKESCVPEEETDYSDDFDSSASEIEEEDLPQAGEAREVKSEDDALYADDFEEYESDEDLEEVVNLAREAQMLEPCDDFFAEDCEDEMALSQTLTQTDIFRR
ncbi:serine/threonine-protein kinase nek4-like [Plakobranchus ocellatus]|uniref:non-specific serine/threonine protein kinase n=1 Tax=Plakobranchus ocellatus TaxID=259542 RepID=A0AAV4CSX7_9GAST|nr:serine/threonine-protein kinase nek4-like [Plakobranchus ocellatus]